MCLRANNSRELPRFALHPARYSLTRCKAAVSRGGAGEATPTVTAYTDPLIDEAAAERQLGGPLFGRRIVVPESRQLDLFSAMLDRQGASVLRHPLVAVRPLQDTAELDAWLRRLAAGHHHLLAFYTGDGVSHLFARAEEIGLRGEVLAAAAQVQKIARGPKPVAALRKLGLSADATTKHPTTDGLLELMASMPLEGRCVGVQLYPAAPSDQLEEALRRMGAGSDPVLPYRYAADAEQQEVALLIREMAAGKVDLIAFTSQLQVHRLQQVGERLSLQRELKQAFERTRIAAIGPVTADAVARAGGKAAVQPASNFHLKRFVAEIVDALR